MSEPIVFGRPFVLRRDRDISDVSGTGIIADGTLFPDGHAVIHWRGRWPLTTPHPDGIDSIMAIHDHGGRGDLHIIWADADTIPVANHLEAANRAQVEIDRLRGVAGRAYLLADRWEAAHGLSAFLVRVAGAELHDELDGADECDHRLESMLSGIFSGGPCIRRGPHDEHETVDGTKFSLIGAATPAPPPVIPWTGPKPTWAEDLRAALVSSCSNPDHACVKCGDCAYEHPGEGGCTVGQLPPVEGRSARTACIAAADQGPPIQGPLSSIEVRDPCPYCTGGPLYPRRVLGQHIETTHARVLAALARGVSLDEVLHQAEMPCDLPHEMEV